MKPNILITGPTGNTGQAVVHQLAEQKVPFRVLLHTPAKRLFVDLPDVEIVMGDFSDAPSLRKALSGIEKTYLLSPPSPDHVERQKVFVDIARESGVRHIVKLAAFGTAHDSPVGLLRGHAAIEEHLRLSGLDYTLVRPHFFMENLLGNADSVRRDGAIYSPVGEGKLNPVSVLDIGAAVAAILTGTGHEGKTYTLTGPAAITYAGIAEALSAVLGTRVQYRVVPFETARQGMLGMGMPAWLVDDMILLMRTWAEGKGAVVTTDVERLTGRKPIGVHEFFRMHRHAFERAA